MFLNQGHGIPRQLGTLLMLLLLAGASRTRSTSHESVVMTHEPKDSEAANIYIAGMKTALALNLCYFRQATTRSPSMHRMTCWHDHPQRELEWLPLLCVPPVELPSRKTQEDSNGTHAACVYTAGKNIARLQKPEGVQSHEQQALFAHATQLDAPLTCIHGVMFKPKLCCQVQPQFAPACEV